MTEPAETEPAETKPTEVVPNLIFFNFDVFAFHNMGQMNISWREKFPDSLACNPDTRFAALDSLQTIVTEFQGNIKQQQPEKILLFKSDENSFEKLLNFIELNAKSAHEYTDHLREFLSQYLMLKDTDPKKIQKICKFAINGLLKCNSYQEYFQSIKTHLPQGLDSAQEQEEFYKVLLAVHRSIPQPWNALAAGLTFQNILGLEPERIECHPKYPAYKIQNVLDIDDSDNTPKEYKDFVKQIQLYLEYVLVHNTPQDWTTDKAPAGKEDLSAVLLPLIDNGFFRGLLVFVPPEVQPFWDKDHLIRYHWEQCLTLTQSIRHAFETTLLNTLISHLKNSQEDREDLHEAFLANISKIQEIALGSLWKVKSTAKLLSVTGYGRRFRVDKDKTEPGVFCYRSYRDYKEFYEIKANGKVSENALYEDEEKIVKKMWELHRNNAYSFFARYPKIEQMPEDFHDSLYANDHSFYKTRGLSIKWRMTLPVLQGDDFKAVYFLYYRDPLWILHDKDNGYQKVVLLSKIVEEKEKAKARNQIFSARARQIMKFFSTVDAHEEGNRQIQRHSVKAAVSAIISRNHSHHIGSHVTPRTSVVQIEERLKELTANSYYKDISQTNHFKIISILKDRLDRYIQKKAEFTAEVATDPLLSTKSALLFDDVLLKFVENTLLMDNIGANEEVRYNQGGESEIRIHFFFSNTELVARYGALDPDAPTYYSSLDYPYIGCEEDEKNEIQDLTRERIEKYETQDDGSALDPKVALPGPVGEFAIYSFLENLIRNSVKHNRDKLQSAENSKRGLDIYLQVTDQDNDFYRLEIWDNVTETNKKKELDLLIRESLIKKHGQLKKKGWGIAEMKIMATLLMGSLDFLDMKDTLKVTTIHWEGKACLGYALKLMKAKELSIVSSRIHSQLTPKTHNALRNKGIWCFSSVAEFKDYLKAGDRPRAFNFIAVDKPNDKAFSIDKLAENEAQLPFRLLVHKEALNPSTITSFPGCFVASERYFKDLKALIPDDEKTIERTWKEWVNRFSDKYKVADTTVALYLEQKRNDTGLESPSREWAKLAEDMLNNEKMPLALMYQTGPNTTNLTPGIQSKVALYDRHGQGLIHFLNKDVEPDSILFYEAFSKNCLDFTHLFSGPRSSIAYYELLEAALLKILILDERVAQFAGHEMNLPHAEHLFGVSKPTRLAVARKAGIYICTHVQIDDGDLKPLHQASNQISGGIKARISTSGGALALSVVDRQPSSEPRQFDAVIIHQGIMDSDGILNEPIDKKLGGQDSFLNSLKNFIPYIVVDSGRGIPPQLSSQIKFLPFSILQDFLLGPLIAKIGLVRAIMPLTRRK